MADLLASQKGASKQSYDNACFANGFGTVTFPSKEGINYFSFCTQA